MKRIIHMTLLVVVMSFALVANAVRADVPTAPAIPADQTRFYAVYNPEGPTGEDGYWLWNYMAFEKMEHEGYASYTWNPRWEWYGKRVLDAFASKLVDPDAFQLQMLIDPRYEALRAEALLEAYADPATGSARRPLD